MIFNLSLSPESVGVGGLPPKANPGTFALTGLGAGVAGFDASTPALIAPSSPLPAALASCAAESSADVGVLLSNLVPPGVVPIAGFGAVVGVGVVGVDLGPEEVAVGLGVVGVTVGL